MTQPRYYATGKRKSAIARVYMKAGNGNIVVNKRSYEEYFTRPSLKMLIKQPLDITGKKDQFDLYVNCQRRRRGWSGRRCKTWNFQSSSGI